MTEQDAVAVERVSEALNGLMRKLTEDYNPADADDRRGGEHGGHPGEHRD